MPKIALGYGDINLVPNKCVVGTRSQCDTTYFLEKLGFNFTLPVIPANMASVIDWNVYSKYDELGLMSIMHRFDVDPFSFCSGVDARWRAISVGINNEDESLAKLANWKAKIPNAICIDIAHGHSNKVRETIGSLKVLFPDSVIIAGNVTTPKAVVDLQNWGADMIKVGIGGGHVCSTRHKTGFHVPMFTAIMDCAEVATVPIIADGGIKENGDIAKALVAGADLVMVGSLFAACTDSPAKIIEGKKEYYGSASVENKGFNRNVEGFAVHLTPTMTIEQKFNEMKEDLQSAISYAGGTCLKALDLANVQYTINK